MLQLLSATGYITFVSLLFTFSFSAYKIDIFHTLSKKYEAVSQQRVLFSLLHSIVADFPIHFLVLQCLFASITSFLGGFDYTLAWMSYYLLGYTSTVLCFIHASSCMAGEKTVIKAIREQLKDEKLIQSVPNPLSWTHLKQMVNPFWTPPDIIIYPNITYATLEEIVDVVTDTNDYHQPKKFTLDIYASKNRKYEEKRPVMIHIHGGAWKWGNKDIFYPHAKYLVSESNWIFVNIEYRTAPRHPYPAQLINIKRAIRWVKQSIRKFGGDPDCIVLSGDSSGGHLASMAGLTINDPFYQPGFESVDTSIMGVVSLYGVLDLQTAPYMTEYFAYAIAMQKSGKIDYDFINRHSPIELLQECNDKGLLVPFLLVHAQNDIIDTPETGKRFKLSYDKINSDAPDMLSSECKIIVLPEAHHYTYILWSPRSLYVSKLIQIWCEDIYNRQHKKAQ